MPADVSYKIQFCIRDSLSVSIGDKLHFSKAGSYKKCYQNPVIPSQIKTEKQVNGSLLLTVRNNAGSPTNIKCMKHPQNIKQKNK